MVTYIHSSDIIHFPKYSYLYIGVEYAFKIVIVNAQTYLIGASMYHTFKPIVITTERQFILEHLCILQWSEKRFSGVSDYKPFLREFVFLWFYKKSDEKPQTT